MLNITLKRNDEASAKRAFDKVIPLDKPILRNMITEYLFKNSSSLYWTEKVRTDKEIVQHIFREDCRKCGNRVIGALLYMRDEGLLEERKWTGKITKKNYRGYLLTDEGRKQAIEYQTRFRVLVRPASVDLDTRYAQAN